MEKKDVLIEQALIEIADILESINEEMVYKNQYCSSQTGAISCLRGIICDLGVHNQAEDDTNESS